MFLKLYRVSTIHRKRIMKEKPSFLVVFPGFDF